MNQELPSLMRLPTLTEVVSLAEEAPRLELPPLQPGTVSAGEAPATPPADRAPSAQGPDPAQLAEQVLREVRQRIDVVLDQKIREALAPALARAADRLLAETRDALSGTLHELVLQAVTAAVERVGGQPRSDEPR